MEPDDERPGTTATVGVDWKPDAELDDAQRWAQIKGQKRGPVAALGWDDALETHRPLMSYDELGGRLEDTPSALYDSLNRLLGLDLIADADTRLKDAEKQLSVRRKTANDNRIQLRRALDDSSDPRAAQVKQLTNRVPYDLDAVTATTLGTKTEQAATTARLRALAALTTPEPTDAAAVANELRAAIEHQVAGADAAVQAMAARATLLRQALHLYHDIGEGTCPVCEVGRLDTTWQQTAQERLEAADADTAKHQEATARLTRARSAAEGIFATVSGQPPIEGVELTALAGFNDALKRAQSTPDNLADLPTHVEVAALDLVEAAGALRAEAGQRAAELEDAWAPIARAIATWVDLETAARKDDDRLDRVKTALKWLRANAETLRERRLAPMVDQARHI